MDIREYAKAIAIGNMTVLDLVPGVPKMSTNSIGALISKAVKDMLANQCYVNVGVWHGFSLLAGMVGNPDKRCIGVDNFSIFNGPRREFRERFLTARSDKHEFFDMDYKTYFEKYHKGDIGFYFYDAAHDYQNQFDGLKWAEPFLAEGAFVMVDDTDCIEPRNATLNFIKQSDFNYEIVIDVNGKEDQTELPSVDPDIKFKASPLWWNGIIVLQKRGLKGKEITEEQAEG